MNVNRTSAMIFDSIVLVSMHPKSYFLMAWLPWFKIIWLRGVDDSSISCKIEVSLVCLKDTKNLLQKVERALWSADISYIKYSVGPVPEMEWVGDLETLQFWSNQTWHFWHLQIYAYIVKLSRIINLYFNLNGIF